MRRVDNIGELYEMVHELFVETTCPVCENIIISTMPHAERILTFGCVKCGDIEQSVLLQMNIHTNDTIIESMATG